MASRHDPKKAVARQLGRNLSIPFRVALKCGYGWPAVIESDPFTPGGKPNPNLYYLTCPYLRRRIARLEDSGLMASLTEMIRRNRKLREDLSRHQEAHRREWLRAARRWRRMMPAGSNPPNIAATRGDELLKCLHAHFAWHLVHEDYLLGRIIAGEVGEIWCADETCRGLMADSGKG